MIRAALLVLALALPTAACGSEGRTADPDLWDEFFDWCIDHAADGWDCGWVTDHIQYSVDGDWGDRTCLTRVWKGEVRRVYSGRGEEGEINRTIALGRCVRDDPAKIRSFLSGARNAWKEHNFDSGWHVYDSLDFDRLDDAEKERLEGLE